MIVSRYESFASLFPIPSLDSDQVSRPQTAPLVDLLTEIAEFDDGAPHPIALLDVLDGRTNISSVFVTAHDTASARSAAAVTGVFLSRYGAGPVVLIGAVPPVPIPLNYDPAPWGPTAQIVVPTPTSIAVEVTGVPGVKIKWKASYTIVGSQSR